LASPVTLSTLLASATPQAAAPVLQPGAVMQALVAQLLDELGVRLQLPGGATLDVKTDQPLPVGTRVQLAVEGTAAQPKILLTPLAPLPTSANGPIPAPANAEIPAPAKGQISAPTSGPIPAPANGSPPVSTSGPASAQIAPPNLDSSTARILENVRALSASSALSTPAQSVGAQSAPTPSVSASSEPVATLSPPQQALQVAVTAMVRDSVAKQNGLAPLMADVEAALARPDIPQPVRAAAAELLALRLPTDAPVTAPAIKAALIGSGIVGDPATLQPAQPTGGDLKAALATLKEALTNWISAAESMADPKAMVARPATPVAAPLPISQRANVPPPHRFAPTIAQAPAPANLPEEVSAREAAVQLLSKTEGAQARQTLLQIASLPDDPGASRPEQSGPRLTLDIPLVTPQGTGVAQLRVEREGSRRDGPDIRPVWRANFSIDVEPIGPVHASIALFGERAAVTLYAERDESAERLREGLPILEAGLKDAAFETGELLCRSGAPAAQRSAPGVFVDQAS
jgi:hypothetical protein